MDLAEQMKLAIELRDGVHQFANINCLNIAITLYRKALDSEEIAEVEQHLALSGLSHAFQLRYLAQGEEEDLNGSIDALKRVLEFLPSPNPARFYPLPLLRARYLWQFYQKGDINEVAIAVSFCLSAIREDEEAEKLFKKGTDALVLSERASGLIDLDEAISDVATSLHLRPAPHPNRAGSLNNLASSLWTRFAQKGQFSDLEDCIELHRQALVLRPAPHPNRSSSLDNLASALSTRFEQKGQFSDLDDCIELHRQALNLIPAPQPNRSSSLNNLASALSTRFEQKGQFSDLEESIELHRQALDLRPAPHPNRAGSLNNLANVLWTRFEQKGQFSDLKESIGLHRQALDLRPAPHPNRANSLNNLASALSIQFQQKGQFSDLEECIELHRQALDLFSAPHPNRANSLNNLASALWTRRGSSRTWRSPLDCTGKRWICDPLLIPIDPAPSITLLLCF